MCMIFLQWKVLHICMISTGTSVSISVNFIIIPQIVYAEQHCLVLVQNESFPQVSGKIQLHT